MSLCSLTIRFWNRAELWRNQQRASPSPSTEQNTPITSVPANEQAGSLIVVPTGVALASAKLGVQPGLPGESSNQVATVETSTDSPLAEEGSAVVASSKSLTPGKSSQATAIFATSSFSTVVGSIMTKYAVPSGNTCTFYTQPQSKDITMQANPTEIPIGLISLDIDKNSDVGIKVFAQAVSPASIEVHLQSPVNGIFGAKDGNFQYGKFSTVEDHSPLPQKRQKQNSRKITFLKPFQRNPKVVVWLNAFHMSNKDNWRCKTFATGITPNGFIIHIDTWASTVMYSAEASWMAYDPDLPNISSGSFNTMDVRPWYIPRRKNQGAATFHPTFGSVPRVLTGLNSLDISNKTNLRLKLEVDDISAKGLTWHLDTWADTILYSAGASYIAFLDT